MKNLIAKHITDSVQERLGDTYRVTTQDVVKNNGLILKGLVIRHGKESMSPTIYLDDFIDAFSHGIPLKEITDVIVQIYYENKNQHFNSSSILSFSNIKDKIFYQLINTSQNEELLKEIPSIPFLDLSIIFRVLIDSNSNNTASFKIHNSHLNMWNTTIDEIYHLAQENTPKILPANLMNINDIFRTLNNDISSFVNMEAIDICPMYTLSNSNFIYGSSCILYPNVLCDFAEAANSNIYILPSSVNEVILIPDFIHELDPQELKIMVHDVNNTVVPKDEVLSDNIYFYSKSTNVISQL